jgi:hypothetical protein
LDIRFPDAAAPAAPPLPPGRARPLAEADRFAAGPEPFFAVVGLPRFVPPVPAERPAPRALGLLLRAFPLAAVDALAMP